MKLLRQILWDFFSSFRFRIYLYVSQLPGLLEKFMAVSDSATFRAMFTDPLKVSIEDMAKYQEMVEQTIDMDAVDKGDFLVNAEFDEELKSKFN